jgi:hypothetical protein
MFNEYISVDRSYVLTPTQIPHILVSRIRIAHYSAFFMNDLSRASCQSDARMCARHDLREPK